MPTYPQGFIEMVKQDILRIDDALINASNQDKFNLHKEIDARYQACVKDWFSGLYRCDKEGTRVYYNMLYSEPIGIEHNLRMMKGKLETFVYGVNAVESPAPSTTVNVTTNVNLFLTFDEARHKIEDMTSLSQEETDEILEHIDTIEEISKDCIPAKKKWEKLRPIAMIALDKGLDIGIMLLSLILQCRFT